ncbi:hypothetical protein EDB85DRAFT_2151670 [Lactarius pseudohatsudake]|nr:hypothetical protein EDB85DRAFT_2151670 [Lactarius pseudohatsudake]
MRSRLLPQTHYLSVNCFLFARVVSLATLQNWIRGSRAKCSSVTSQSNKIFSNAYSFIANSTGYTNIDVFLADIPLANITGTIPGPLNAQFYVPITVPNTSAVGAGGGPLFVASGLDTSFTAASAPASVNLTA